MAAITVNGHTVDAVSQQHGGSQFVPNASESNFILIHCQDFLKNDQIKILKDLGVVFLEYPGQNTYLCRYEPKDLEIIRALPFVVYANVYHQDLVLNSRLKEKASSQLIKDDLENEAAFDVFVAFHHESATRTTAQMLQHLADILNVNPNTISEDGHRVRMSLLARDLERVASIDDVQTIEEIPPIVFCNNAARTDLKIESTVPKYLSTAITQNVYDGSGEVVVVNDSGFDQGVKKSTSAITVHPAFGNRVVKLVNAAGEAWLDDFKGHGTHVCGSVAGDGYSTQFGPVKGTAPKARLVVQSIVASTGFPKLASLTNLMVTPYIANNARIHTNSWVTSPIGTAQVGYDESANIIDTVTYQKNDLVVLFGAGNHGAQWAVARMPAQIGAQSAAKNCITVGACESSKPLSAVIIPATMTAAADRIDYKYSSWAWGKGNISNVADFSSRGPTVAPGPGIPGRNKPDVVAPGVDIYSARSQASPLRWPHKTPDGQNDLAYFGTSTDNLWIFQSGTSMATPLVAGCCAVLRQCLLRHTRRRITSALIKALIVNNAEDLQGSQHTRGPNPIPPAPGPAQGFGRVNQAASLRNIVDTKNGGWFPSKKALSQGRAFRKTILISNNNMDPTASPPTPLPATLKATLVWTDPPGQSLNSALTLKVEVKSTPTTFVYANGGPDLYNNVQKVVWQNVPQGEVTLVVEAVRISPIAENVYNNQHFALVWYVEYGEPSMYQKVFRFWNAYRPSMEAIRLAMGYEK